MGTPAVLYKRSRVKSELLHYLTLTMSLANLGKNFQDRVHRAPQEWQSTHTSPSGGGYSSPEDGIDVEEEEEVNTFINDFLTQKAKRIEQAYTISSMSVGLVLRRKYSVREIKEVESRFGRQQVWTLVDKEDATSRKIWAPPSLAETVTERDVNGVLYFSQKKRDIVVKSVILHYLGCTDTFKGSKTYKFNLSGKYSK